MPDQQPPPSARIEDASLRQRAAAGDAAAFGALVEHSVAPARRLARAMLGDADEADDVVQDAVLGAWKAADRYDATRPFAPWLLRIVVNAARDALRRRKVRAAEPLAPELAASSAGPDRETDRSLLREALRTALAQLPERQRVAVTLFDGEGWSHAEIAALLGIPEGTVRSDLFHGRRALRVALGPYREDAW